MDAVLILEDDALVRAAIARQVNASESFCVAAEAADLPSARTLVETTPASLGIFDLGLEGGSALPLIAVAVARGMAVLVLTIWDDDDTLYQALAAGAGGYVLKDDASFATHLVDALAALRDGGAPISPAIARRLLNDLRPRSPDPDAGAAAIPDVAVLSEREREIIELFAKGATYQEVADMLELSVNTVRHHVRRMYRKLHVCSKSEAVTLAYRRS